MKPSALASTLLGSIAGPWEMMLLLAVMVILAGAKGLPGLGCAVGQGLGEFIKASGVVLEECARALGLPTRHESRMARMSSRIHSGVALWLAQGLGIGRTPRAPGTFGSLAGLVWFALLLAPGRIWVYLGGLVVGFGFSVWCCGAAEQLLQKTDPPSVVLDEIVAMPLCFAVWIGWLFFRTGRLPTPAYFFSAHAWAPTFAVFVLFRFFDVVKPWPVRQSQTLPGGWGVTVDDMLAAAYVNLLVGALAAFKTLSGP